MSFVLGIDTSNYTTSCALLDTADMRVRSCKKLLPVKQGERGLRQSDGVSPYETASRTYETAF